MDNSTHTFSRRPRPTWPAREPGHTATHNTVPHRKSRVTIRLAPLVPQPRRSLNEQEWCDNTMRSPHSMRENRARGSTPRLSAKTGRAYPPLTSAVQPGRRFHPSPQPYNRAGVSTPHLSAKTGVHFRTSPRCENRVGGSTPRLIQCARTRGAFPLLASSTTRNRARVPLSSARQPGRRFPPRLSAKTGRSIPPPPLTQRARIRRAFPIPRLIQRARAGRTLRLVPALNTRERDEAVLLAQRAGSNSASEERLRKTPGESASATRVDTGRSARKLNHAMVNRRPRSGHRPSFLTRAASPQQ